MTRFTEGQGRSDPRSLAASRAALGMNPNTHGLEGPVIRWAAVLMVVIALAAALSGR